MRYWAAGVVVLLIVGAMGCGRKTEGESSPSSPKQASGPRERPTTFSIADTNTVVSAEAIPHASSSRKVRADFNQDDLEDIAVATTAADGTESVDIYLRKSTSDMLKEEYFLAGGIRHMGDYTISALMTARAGQHTDLLVMFNYPGGTKELVHYRSEGNQFTEVDRRTRP